MKMKHPLTNLEARRLKKFLDENGGHVLVAGLWGVSPITLERAVRRVTVPHLMLRKKLVEVGIIVK